MDPCCVEKISDDELVGSGKARSTQNGVLDELLT